MFVSGKNSIIKSVGRKLVIGMLKLEIKRILKKIKQYDTIVIARHTSPDPDAVASQISLRDIIKLNFPKKNVYAVGVSVNKFKYYGVLDKIDASKLSHPLLIALDVPNASRIDGVDLTVFNEIFKIDHHPTDEIFGPCDWVDESASSTCQLITEFLLSSGLNFNRKIAENLFLGTVSDSERFLISYTTAKTFRLVSELIEKSEIDFVSLYKYLYERPYNEIKFHGYLSSNLTITDNGFAYILISSDVLKEFEVDAATPSNMINDFSNIKGVFVWAFVTFDDKCNVYKVNIRSNGPVINETAALYGGGGHKFASGVRTEDKEVIDKLLISLDEDCKRYKESLEK